MPGEIVINGTWKKPQMAPIPKWCGSSENRIVQTSDRQLHLLRILDCVKNGVFGNYGFPAGEVADNPTLQAVVESYPDPRVQNFNVKGLSSYLLLCC